MSIYSSKDGEIKAIREGFLLKRESNKWISMYFLLFDVGIVYYTKEFKEFRFNKNIFAMELPHLKSTFLISDLDNTYILAAETIEQKNIWFSSIQNSIKIFLNDPLLMQTNSDNIEPLKIKLYTETVETIMNPRMTHYYEKITKNNIIEPIQDKNKKMSNYISIKSNRFDKLFSASQINKTKFFEEYVNIHKFDSELKQPSLIAWKDCPTLAKGLPLPTPSNVTKRNNSFIKPDNNIINEFNIVNNNTNNNDTSNNKLNIPTKPKLPMQKPNKINNSNDHKINNFEQVFADAQSKKLQFVNEYQCNEEFHATHAESTNSNDNYTRISYKIVSSPPPIINKNTINDSRTLVDNNTDNSSINWRGSSTVKRNNIWS